MTLILGNRLSMNFMLVLFKAVIAPDMTYNVFGGTLTLLNQPITAVCAIVCYILNPEMLINVTYLTIPFLSDPW